jgi:conjugative relaxase-like TrwC/TraI family protein
MELGLSGAVSAGDLRAVLLGRSPTSGEHLTARPGLRQRHGWDLILAAPKSVSLLAAALPESSSQVLREAYRHAVCDTSEMLEDSAACVRRGGRHEPSWVVAACFEHLTSDAGEPHLHSHVVLANLGLGREHYWGCLAAGQLWRWREALGAGFQLALRAHLAKAGLDFTWELSGGGLGEISSVPVEARRAASSRSRALRAEGHQFGSSSAAAARTAQGVTRGVRSAGPGTSSEWGAGAASAIMRDARAAPPTSSPPAPTLVAEALAGRASVFAEPDVLVALAETSPGGLDLREARAWARNWCVTSPSAGWSRDIGADERYRTTALARVLDLHVLDAATEARFAHLAEVSPSLAERELAELGVPDQVTAAAVHLACGGAGVAVVPRAPWLAQAACIDAARAAWQAGGYVVHVSCPNELAERRWHALTSLRSPGVGPWRPQGDGTYGRRVLVVDAADHLSPKALVGLVDQAASAGTKLVLVAGGTVPGHGPCLACSLDQLLGEVAPVLALLAVPSLAPAANPCVSLAGIRTRGSLTGTDAMAHLVEAWCALAPGTEPARRNSPPLMVAFGPAEAEVLNLRARSTLLEGRPEVPQLLLGERRYALGERVLALRRIGGVNSATLGTVVALGPRSLGVEWEVAGGTARSDIGSGQAGSLGYGYATTVPYLRASQPAREILARPERSPGTQAGSRRLADLLVLGDPLELGGQSARARGACATVPGPGPLEPSGLGSRQKAAVIELATNWPDEEMLRRAGPRPVEQPAADRWAQAIARCAVDRARSLGVGPAQLSTTRAPSARVVAM